MLNVASLVSSDVHLERVVGEGEVYSPSREDHMHETPHCSPNPIHDTAQPSPARAEQRHDETSHVPHNPLPPFQLVVSQGMTAGRMSLTVHILLQLMGSQGMTTRRMSLTVYILLQLVPSQSMTRRCMCLPSHNLL
jgi:hypothetical protein